MKTEMYFLPQARSTGLVVKEVDDELLVYDREGDKAHCLNPTAAAIWRLCDGRTSADQIARRLASTQESELQRHDDGDALAILDIETNDELVWLGLQELSRIHLLQIGASSLVGWSGMSRREAVRRIGLGAAIALPIIVSMTAPTAVQAAVSCGARCKPCSTGTECCSGSCSSASGCPGGGMKCV